MNSWKVICSVCLLVTTHTAQAIVSMESVHLGKPPEGYSGALDVNASGAWGNTQTQIVAAGLKLVRHKNPITDFMLVNYQYGESRGARDKNKAFIHGRHIQQITEKYAWEGFAQLSKDEFTRLKRRGLLGAGARMGLWQSSKVTQGFLGLGGFYEQEKLDVDTALGESDKETAWRGNMYFVIKTKLNTAVSLLSTTYYQPDLNKVADFRAIEDASLVSQLTDKLAAKITLDVSHDSKPPSGVKQTDTSLTVGVDLSF